MSPRTRSLLVASFVLSLGSSGAPPAPVMMRALRIDYAGSARCLVVFLPGFGDTAEDFERNGFAAAVRNSGLAIDVVAANATLGYYLHAALPERVHEDVLTPARARRSYEQTWLFGVSMGGLGALMATKAYPDEIDGAFVMAPYLGRAKLAESIRAAGGLHAWTAPADDAYDYGLWRFLQASSASPSPKLHVGWGVDDRLAPSDRVLGDALPPDRVYTAPGAHEWPTWNDLLAQFLARGPLARLCPAR